MIFELNVQGIPVKVLGDSGSTKNILYANHWASLKERLSELGRMPKFVTRHKKLLCANGTPLNITGYVNLQVKTKSGFKARVTFEIASETQAKDPLLSEQSMLDLGLIQYHPDGDGVHSAFSLKDEQQEQIQALHKKYRRVFEGIGKFKGKPIDISVTSDFKQILLPARDVPVHLQEAVVRELKSMLDSDILEIPPEGSPMMFCSPIHVVLKPTKEGEPQQVRITVDFSMLNKYIRRDRHVNAWRFEHFSHRLEKMRFKARLDLKSMYHQFEISEKCQRCSRWKTRTKRSRPSPWRWR